MNIYHITRKDEVLGSQYKAAIIIAVDEDSARSQAQKYLNPNDNEVSFPFDMMVNCSIIGISVLTDEQMLMTEFIPGSLDSFGE